MWLQVDSSILAEAIGALRSIGRIEIASTLQRQVDRAIQRARMCEKYRKAADKLHHREGELEFDDNAPVSIGFDDGAYVMGWKWITDEEAGIRRNVSNATSI